MDKEATIQEIRELMAKVDNLLLTIGEKPHRHHEQYGVTVCDNDTVNPVTELNQHCYRCDTGAVTALENDYFVGRVCGFVDGKVHVFIRTRFV